MAGVAVTVSTRFATGTAIQTLIQILSIANIRVRLIEVGFGFEGTSNTDAPLDIAILRQTDAGTGTASTESVLDESIGVTPGVTGVENHTSEPTDGAVLNRFSVHPQTARVWVPTPTDEIWMEGATRLATKILTAPSVSVNGSYYMNWEE